MWKKPKDVADLERIRDVWVNLKGKCILKSVKLYKKPEIKEDDEGEKNVLDDFEVGDNGDDGDNDDGEDEEPPDLADLDPEENIKKIMFTHRKSLGYIEIDDDFDSDSTFTDDDDEY